jgi:hypothetical protein
MKQYLVIKVVKDISQKVAEWTPLPGLFTEGAAEGVIEAAREQDPEGNFLLQEVGQA